MSSEWSISELPNRSIFALAEAFHEGASLAKEESVRLHPVAIVNGGFALELYLKSIDSERVFSGEPEIEPGIYLHEQVFSRVNLETHDAVKLWKSIDMKTKQHLEEKLPWALRERYGSVSNALKPVRNVFVEWRYLFEGRIRNPVPISDLFDLLQFLREEIPNLSR